MADSKKKAAKASKAGATKKNLAKAQSGRQESRSAAAAVPVTVGTAGVGIYELHSSSLVVKTPWCGAVTSVHEAEAAAPSAAAYPAALPDPVRAPIDRSVPPDVFTVDTPVRPPDSATVVVILRRPLGFPSGSLPGDPGAFSAVPSAADSICHVLAPAAAARCATRGRYR